VEGRAFFFAAVATLCGAALALPLDGLLRALLCAAVCAAALRLACNRSLSALLLPFGAALALGYAAAAWHHPPAPTLPAGHTTRFACTVLDVSEDASNDEHFTCESDSGEVFSAMAAAGTPRSGERLLIRGRIEAFDGPRNPGEPDLAAIERERGLAGQIQGARILGTLAARVPTLPVRIATMHAWALQQLRARMGEPYASIVAGELWGERAALAPNVRTEFQETGTVHILVTAGLHLGVVALIAVTLLRFLRAPRAAVSAIAIAAIWGYAFFSGFHLPSQRAATMISFALVAYAYGAAPVSWNAYGAALGTIALFRPDDIAGASFALSFSCVGAILLLNDTIGGLLRHIAFPDAVREALTLSIATQIGTWPLTAATFLLFAPYAVLANVLVVPVVGVTMMLAAVQLACAALPPLAQAAANLDAWLLAWIVAVVSTISGLPYAAIPQTPAPAWCIAAYDAALLGGVWCLRRGARTAAIAILASGVMLVIAPPVLPDTHLRITVLDVGQADAIVIQTPLQHAILVDAGGRLERGPSGASSAEQIGERVVVPFLRRAGISRIDALILSHPHGDHAGGLAPILRNYGTAGELADSGQKYGGYAYNDALQTARSERVRIIYPRAGAVWRTEDGVSLIFIGPSLPFIESNNTINDNSIAFILQYRSFRMLFTGDAGVAAEERFLSEGIDLHADVLKAGHHGSAYSSSTAFIDAVHPAYAIISVGRHNMFGHPAPSTIDTLQRFGARVYRTDQNGAVSVVTDGRGERVTGMLTL
jgi:competence protein ComEC